MSSPFFLGGQGGFSLSRSHEKPTYQPASVFNPIGYWINIMPIRSTKDLSYRNEKGEKYGLYGERLQSALRDARI
jgi:hypothetical protein